MASQASDRQLQVSHNQLQTLSTVITTVWCRIITFTSMHSNNSPIVLKSEPGVFNTRMVHLKSCTTCPYETMETSHILLLLKSIQTENIQAWSRKMLSHSQFLKPGQVLNVVQVVIKITKSSANSAILTITVKSFWSPIAPQIILIIAI